MASLKQQKTARRAKPVTRAPKSWSQLTAPRAMAKALLAANGYVFSVEHDQNDRALRAFDAVAVLKALRGLGFVVVPKPKVQP